MSKLAANQRTIVFAVLAVALAGTAIVLAQPALAQTTNSTAPAIKGSVSLANATNAFVKDNVKVDFNTAANTAKGQITNGVVVGGQLSSVQGYLAYTFRVANYDAGTMKVVVVDAGNGSVLYTSNDLPLYNGGIGGGGGCHHGGYGHGMGHMRGSMSGTTSGSATVTGTGVIGSNL